MWMFSAVLEPPVFAGWVAGQVGCCSCGPSRCVRLLGTGCVGYQLYPEILVRRLMCSAAGCP